MQPFDSDQSVDIDDGPEIFCGDVQGGGEISLYHE
jgi:hypothetical protein